MENIITDIKLKNTIILIEIFKMTLEPFTKKEYDNIFNKLKIKYPNLHKYSDSSKLKLVFYINKISIENDIDNLIKEI